MYFPTTSAHGTEGLDFPMTSAHGTKVDPSFSHSWDRMFIPELKKDAASIMRLPRDINHPNIRFVIVVFLNFGATYVKGDLIYQDDSVCNKSVI